MWELDYKESWVLKNWCFWTVVLEKTLENPLDCKEIQPVNPKGDQSWVFIGRTDVKAETPILWPPHAKSWLIWKDPDAGKDWGQEEKGTTEDKMVGWHHGLDGHGFGWIPGVGDGQGGLACCGSWDTTEQMNWTENPNTPPATGSQRCLSRKPAQTRGLRGEQCPKVSGRRRPTRPCPQRLTGRARGLTFFVVLVSAGPRARPILRVALGAGRLLLLGAGALAEVDPLSQARQVLRHWQRLQVRLGAVQAHLLDLLLAGRLDADPHSAHPRHAGGVGSAPAPDNNRRRKWERLRVPRTAAQGKRPRRPSAAPGLETKPTLDAFPQCTAGPSPHPVPAGSLAGGKRPARGPHFRPRAWVESCCGARKSFSVCERRGRPREGGIPAVFLRFNCCLLESDGGRQEEVGRKRIGKRRWMGPCILATRGPPRVQRCEEKRRIWRLVKSHQTSLKSYKIRA